MDIEYNPRIELVDLVCFIATEKGITESEAENLLPAEYFEGAYLRDDDDADWCSEAVQYLRSRDISAVEVYQE